MAYIFEAVPIWRLFTCYSLSFFEMYGHFLQKMVVFCNHIDESVIDTYHFTCESVTFSGFRYINAYILPMYDSNKVCHKFAEI